MIVPNGNGFYLHPVDNQLSGRVRATRARTGYGDPIVKNFQLLAAPLFLISEFQVQGMNVQGDAREQAFQPAREFLFSPESLACIS